VTTSIEIPEVEQAVAAKFRESLGMEIAGDADFFLSGGDSLGAVEISVWAADCYNIRIEISCMFNYATISSLSEHIRELIRSKASTEIANTNDHE
jgi:acyl carrier protein